MRQDPAQNFLLWGILLILTIIVVMWLFRGCESSRSRYRNSTEGYSPYRRTGGCPPRTGWTYLDAYEQEDYYRKYPYIYPTPTSYTRAWYKLRRKNANLLEQERQRIEAALHPK